MSMIATTDNPFARHMEPVARKLLGDPNPHMSSASELRFGTNGSMSVDLELGVWSDHEAKEGGGVLDLLRRELRIEGRDAIEWLNREVGAEFEDRPREANNVRPLKRIVATYDYIDEHGEVLFQTVRFEPKGFSQRRPDPGSRDGWAWSVKGVRQVPYRLPAVMAAVTAGETIWIVEGEKDADALAREGLCATCNAMGAGKWPAELSEPLRGADVVILRDNDDAGANHAAIVASALMGHAKQVRTLDLPGMGPKEDVSDWLAMGGDGGALVALAEGLAKDWTPERPKSRFGAVMWSDIDRVSINYPPLVKGLIHQGDMGMIYGESGSGKSFLAVDMGLSIARGVPFLGMKAAQGSVLYQAGEGGRGLLMRLRAYRDEYRVVGDVPFVLLPEKVNLFAEDGDAEAFIDECMAWKASLPDPLLLVVIDTFSAASVGANENASEDMGRMLEAGYRLNKATGAAVIWVHHKNAGGLRERGHTSFRANIETVIEVSKDAETKARTLHLVKMKDGEDGLKLGFELQPIEIGVDDDGDRITSCVVRPAQMESPRTSKRFRLPAGQHNFLKVLDDAIRHRGAIVPVGEHADPGTYGVSWADFRDLYKQVCGAGKEPGAIRTAISRDGDALWRAGFIERQDEWFWITPRGGELV